MGKIPDERTLVNSWGEERKPRLSQGAFGKTGHSGNSSKSAGGGDEGITQKDMTKQ